MKILNIKHTALALLLGAFALTSCDDFLDRPGEDGYNKANFYQNDEQARQGVNPLYNSPWYDFLRGFINVGEVLSGNIYSNNAYLNFTVNGSSDYIADMSASLWAVNAHANVIWRNLEGAGGVSKTVKENCIGEVLTWKAMAYFYLVRSYGAVPIVHSNSDIISSNGSNDMYKAKISNVYEYIIADLKAAIELLPEKDATGKGRIDKYCAEALLAKVYLTKAGFSEEHTKYNPGIYSYITTTKHSLNEEDLKMAAYYAKDVIENSGRHLMENYSDIFRGENNVSQESLLAWRWSSDQSNWTSQNSLQSDLAPSGFDEFGDTWGGWVGPSVDLQDAFDEDATKQQRNDRDDRRKATMMMAGDFYPYFYTDCGGFDYLKFCYNAPEYVDHVPAYKSSGQQECATGANCVKHLYGNGADHLKAFGVAASNMRYQTATHILRLADIYLVYCEAMCGNQGSTTDAKALEYFYAVRHRAIKSEQTKPTSITWEQVWNERRLELACEGDRWYDFVRLYYYNPELAIQKIKAQRRGCWYGLNDVYKKYYNEGKYGAWDASSVTYEDKYDNPNVTDRSFTIPLPSADVDFNPHLAEEPVDVDITEYKFK